MKTLMTILAAILLAGCAGTQVTLEANPWGCVGVAAQTAEDVDGNVYRVAYCPDKSVMVGWASSHGLDFWARIKKDEGVKVWMRPSGAEDVPWTLWGDKAGMLPPDTPKPVTTAMEGA